MKAPTTGQLETAIEVLAKLGERLSHETAHSLVQFPDTQLGAFYKASLKARSAEQSQRIDVLSMQLKNWREELSAWPDGLDFVKPSPVRQDSSFAAASGNVWLWIKNLLAAKTSRQQAG
jgi:hypothetical protein